MKYLQPNSELILPVIEPDELILLVGRIGASRHFRQAHRLRAFVEFICEQTLAGNAESLNEHLIGHEVFGRPVGYDSAADNIVRVEARELRKRLAAYFADEGATEPITIRVPKGGYVPVFEPSAVIPEDVAPEAPSLASATPRSRGGEHRFLIAILAFLVVVSVGLNVYQRLQPIPAPGVQPESDALPPLFAAFWSKIFEADRPVLLCMADSNLALLQDLRGEAISFADYTSGRYFASLKDQTGNGEDGRVLAEIASRYYTSVADANTLARLIALNRRHEALLIRSARDLNIRDLKLRNSILLGSSRSNPWVGLLDKRLRFQLEYDVTQQRMFLRDKSPESGRPSTYKAGAPGEAPYDAYGIVAVLPNLDGSGNSILIEGTNMQGTEAAGEFVTSAAKFDPFLREIGWRPDLPLPVFAVALQLTTLGGSSTSRRILAYKGPSR